MNIEITFQINTENLPSYDDQHMVSLWHIAQANPTPIYNREAKSVRLNRNHQTP